VHASTTCMHTFMHASMVMRVTSWEWRCMASSAPIHMANETVYELSAISFFPLHSRWFCVHKAQQPCMRTCLWRIYSRTPCNSYAPSHTHPQVRSHPRTHTRRSGHTLAHTPAGQVTPSHTHPQVRSHPCTHTRRSGHTRGSHCSAAPCWRPLWPLLWRCR